MPESDRTRIRLGLRMLLLGLLLLATGFGIATYGIRRVNQALRDESMAWGKSIASSLVRSLNESIESGEEIEAGVLNRLVRMPGLAYVEVVDSAGAARGRAFAGAGWEERGGVSAGGVAERVEREGRAAFIDIPVQLKRDLTLHVGLDRGSIDARVRPVRGALVTLVFAESVLAILLVAWASRPFIDGLRRAERKYRSIFEHTLEGIFQTTPDGQYISANPALARIYGYDSPAELIRSFSDIATQLYVEAGRREEFRSLLSREGQVRDFESQVRRKDGGVIWITENARAVYDERGRLSYYEGTVLDITDRKRASETI